MPRVPGGSPATHELNRVVHSCNLTVGLWSGLGGCPRLQSKFEATLDQSTNAVLLPTPISTVYTAARPDGPPLQRSVVPAATELHLALHLCLGSLFTEGYFNASPATMGMSISKYIFIFTDSLIAYFPGVQCAISIFEDDQKHPLHRKQLLLPHSSHPPSHREGDCKRPGR